MSQRVVIHYQHCFVLDVTMCELVDKAVTGGICSSCRAHTFQ